ncbi:MAG: ABC transporter ATP-binding protein [Clostridia bacterium]|nr:ABC transporter ATP-binding protein [Clostridia bacterium]
MIKIDNVSKEYKLGQIGGTTLREEFQRWLARVRKKEDPTKKIGAKDYVKGEKFMALNGVSFEVKKGERVGIIGHNGAGKSTLLKLLSRVTAPTDGVISLNGRIASMLEVGTGFHPELTGRENVYMNGAILGMTKKEIDEKMEDIIEFSEVRQFIDTPVKRYSSGMYVKLAFAVAAHLESEIMIMDEVLAVGDMQFQQKCLNKMSDVSRREGRTILYVSHNMNTIRQLCDRVVVLDHGQVVFDGDVDSGIEVYMNRQKNVSGTYIDLSNERMGHLPEEIKAKMTYVTLIGKENPVYEFKEDMRFELKVKANRRLKNLCIRIEMNNFSDEPIGMAYNQELGGIEEGEEIAYDLTLSDCNLVPGRYKALLCLYDVDEFGNYEDLDAVYPGFTFSIVDAKGDIKIAWDAYNWGRVYFGELKRKQ